MIAVYAFHNGGNVISSITGTESGEVFLDRLLGLGHMILFCTITHYDDVAD